MKEKGVERAKREKETVERESRKEGKAMERKLKRRNKSIFLRSLKFLHGSAVVS